MYHNNYRLFFILTRDKLHKMHGTLNDFVIIDCREKMHKNINFKEIANRKTGIGCDQVIVITSSKKADCLMHIYNTDGSKVEMCGNAARCVACLLSNEKNNNNITIELSDRILSCVRTSHDKIQVNMGHAKFHWQDIPISQECDTLYLPIKTELLSYPVGVNIGNPHAVFFVDSIDDIPLPKIGPELENHPLFPKKQISALHKLFLVMRLDLEYGNVVLEKQHHVVVVHVQH